MSQQKTASFTDLELDDVIASREKTLADRPDDMRLTRNLLWLLDCQVPGACGSGVYSRCQNALSSQPQITKLTHDHFDTNFLINSISECREIIGQFNINRTVAVKQIFEGTRHKIKEQPVYCGKFLDFFQENSNYLRNMLRLLQSTNRPIKPHRFNKIVYTSENYSTQT